MTFSDFSSTASGLSPNGNDNMSHIFYPLINILQKQMQKSPLKVLPLQ